MSGQDKDQLRLGENPDGNCGQAPARARDPALSDLFLHDERQPHWAGRLLEEPREQRSGQAIRNIPHHHLAARGKQLAEVDLEDVGAQQLDAGQPADNFPQHPQQTVIQLDRNQPPAALSERQRQSSGPRAHLQHLVTGADADLLHQPVAKRSIDKEVLPEPAPGADPVPGEQPAQLLGIGRIGSRAQDGNT